MSTTFKHRCFALLIVAALAAADFLWVHEANQTVAKRYLNESVGLSAATYATCRVINGGVSSIQESSISLHPWGVGLEYGAGQLLDPINDATERLSDASVKAMALLGVQRLMLVFVNEYTIGPFYILLGGFLVAACACRRPGLPRFLGQGALLLLLLRISSPLLCGVGVTINEQYFKPAFEQEQAELAKVKELALVEFEAEIPRMQFDPVVDEGLLAELRKYLASISSWVAQQSAYLQHRATSLSSALAYFTAHFDEIAISLAHMLALVVEKVALQVFLLPLLLLVGLRKLFVALAGTPLSEWVAALRGETRVVA